jgi:putative phage-type endonuclease
MNPTQITIARSLLQRETNGEFLKQRTEEWFKARKNMITASEASTVLDCNIFQSSYDLMMKKLCQVDEEISHEATEWGNMFEPIAIQFYEFLKKETVHSMGLVPHSKYKWLGASPDGLLLSGKILEIKCPITRNIGGDIPLPYWIQMQIQMESCNINTCDYLECQFYQYKNELEYSKDITSKDMSGEIIIKDKTVYWKLIDCALKTINRDQTWFATNIVSLQKFHDKMNFYRETGVKQLYIDTKQATKKKRTREDQIVSPRKRGRSNNINWQNDTIKNTSDAGLIDWRMWVSATKIRNYMMDDPLIDWLDHHGNHKMPIKYINHNYEYKDVKTAQYNVKDKIQVKNNDNSIFNKFLMKQGTTFEDRVVELLQEQHGDAMVQIATYQQAKSHIKYLETVHHMEQGTPIIYQGVLHNYSNKTFGMPDLLVRSDWLNKIIQTSVIKTKNAKTQAPLLQGAKWHYRVVEIKYTSLMMCADGKHLRNTNAISAHKGQLYIYNKAIGSIQGYTPPKAYIIGRRWMYKNCGAHYRGHKWLDRVAHVDFQRQDRHIRAKTGLAIQWIRDVRFKGHKWSLDPPSRDELRPNMCNASDTTWHTIKQDLAKKTNDITSLWMVGPKNRADAQENGIINWRKQECTADLLGIKGDKTASVLQLIIEYNQDTEVLEPFLPINELKIDHMIYPLKIKNNFYNWRKAHKKKNFVEFYIDFETMSGIILDKIIPITDCSDVANTKTDGGSGLMDMDIQADAPQNQGALIFMVGIGYEEPKTKKWIYKCICVDRLTIENEKLLLLKFHKYIQDVVKTYHRGKCDPNFYHWGHAERTFYNSAMSRHPDIYQRVNIISTWCDFLSVFKDEPIITRGALNFGLKSVVGAFYDNGFINTRWPQDSAITNGMNALIYAYQAHLDCVKTGANMQDTDIIQEITQYNEVDVKVIWEILTYLRGTHI